MARVPARHRARGERGGLGKRGLPPGLTPSTRGLAAHLAWSVAVLAAAGALIAIELSAPCPRGGPLAFGDCSRVRPFVIGVLAVSAVLYVAALSAVRWWVIGLRRRGVADQRAVRDWYLLAAVIGLAVVPLFTFTTLSALR